MKKETKDMGRGQYRKLVAAANAAAEESETFGSKKPLTFFELIYLVRPYFWPNDGASGACVNRLRALSTWLSVALSKITSLFSPYFLASATNDLNSGNYRSSIKYIVIYVALRIASTIFKELQTILYIKVKQQAGIELQENTFRHLHKLSLNWHVR